MAGTPERDDITGTDTTGHEWDGIKELNNPLPKWWLYTFYACCIWSFGYWIIYPAIPLAASYTTGVIGYSARADALESVAANKAAQSKWVDQIAASDLEAITRDPDLMQFALAGGRAAFGDNCAPCHGSGAQGGKGYPNLNDDDWLWGGSLDAIHTTLQHGVRWTADEDTRDTPMPAFGPDGLLTAAEIGHVADHVLSLTGGANATEEGAAIFADQCAACHGEKGEGNPDVGAPDLADAIWLYGGDRPTVVETITYSRRGVMPAWSGRLPEATVKQLAVYIHSLGGGQ